MKRTFIWENIETHGLEYMDVDDLSVKKSQQRYELMNSESDFKIFRYISRSFKSNIIVNNDGFVLEYPKYFKLLTSV